MLQNIQTEEMQIIQLRNHIFTNYCNPKSQLWNAILLINARFIFRVKKNKLLQYSGHFNEKLLQKLIFLWKNYEMQRNGDFFYQIPLV